MKPFLWHVVGLAGVTAGAVAQAATAAKPPAAGPAVNIAQRIERADFSNRVWKASDGAGFPLVSTRALADSQDLNSQLGRLG